MGQVSAAVTTSQWMSWMVQWGIPPHIEYFWRDPGQVADPMRLWGDGEDTSALLAVQNEELPLSIDRAFEILDPYTPFPIVRGFVIGNEADAMYDPDTFAALVLDSIERFHEACRQRGTPMIVSTPLTMRMFGWEAMVLDPLWEPVFVRWLSFLSSTGSPFMINIYPYLSWYNHQDLYSFEAAMTTILPNKIRGLRTLFAQYGYANVPLCVTETGRPTMGNDAASSDNALRYFKHATNISVMENVPIYWFELIDEAYKPGSEDEHHYGLFTIDCHYKFTGITV